MDHWWDHAACRGMDERIFFGHGNGRVNEYRAKLICASCPVRNDCLEAALAEEGVKWIYQRYRYGVRGGKTALERAKMAGTPMRLPGGRMWRPTG